MRHDLKRQAVWCSICVAALASPGCSSAPDPVAPPDVEVVLDPPPAEPMLRVPTPTDEMNVAGDPVAAQVEAYAQRLERAIAQESPPDEPPEAPAEAPANGGPPQVMGGPVAAEAPAADVEWIRPGVGVGAPDRPAEPVLPAPEPAPEPTPAPTPGPGPEPAAADGDPGVPTPQAVANASADQVSVDEGPISDVADGSSAVGPGEGVPEALTREALVVRLLEAVAASAEAPLRRALDAATLDLLGPSQPMAESLLEPLTLDERDRVERYRQLVALIRDRVAEGDGGLDRALLDERLEQLLGQQPIKIREIELCRRVSGYGVYEPFENQTFLAGQDTRMIVYVELDDFYTHALGEGEYEVKLSQELALYNESDGLAVWRSEPVQVVDQSRNQRRDFFVVQLVTLPARVSVGRYQLKVRITDVHGGTVDEATTPVEFVAKEAGAMSE